jgi:hypothetical protein
MVGPNPSNSEGKFFVWYISAKLFSYNCKRIMLFPWLQTNAFIVAEIWSAFSFL